MLTFCAYYSRMLSTFYFEKYLHMNRDFYVIDVKIIKTDTFLFQIKFLIKV